MAALEFAYLTETHKRMDSVIPCGVMLILKSRFLESFDFTMTHIVILWMLERRKFLQNPRVSALKS